jgi:hypothetical protein
MGCSPHRDKRKPAKRLCGLQGGDPAPNAPKWFAAVEVIRLATDKEWLHKATKDVAKYWRQKRGRRQYLPRTTRIGKMETDEIN